MSKKEKSTKINLHFSITRLIVFFVICAVAVTICLCFKTPLEAKLNNAEQSSTIIDENGLSVHFVDVGQGDSIAIRFPDQKTMLVDAGPTKSSSTLLDYLKTKFFKSNENDFDYLLLTHSDEDHCGGMPIICQNFDVKKIYRPKIYSSYNSFDETNGITDGKNICKTMAYNKTIVAFNNETSDIVFTDLSVVNTSQKIYGDNYSVDFYAPVSDYYKAVNDYSPIMVLNYKNKKIMLAGDATTKSENEVMTTTKLPDVDLLKVAHHGSATSTGDNFLQQIKPEYAVISVATKNDYDLPNQQIVNRLQSSGSKIFRTDVNGTIVANITSGISNLNFIFQKQGQSVYIHIEYVMCGIIILSASFCFGSKIKLKQKSTSKNK